MRSLTTDDHRFNNLIHAVCARSRRHFFGNLLSGVLAMLAPVPLLVDADARKGRRNKKKRRQKQGDGQRSATPCSANCAGKECGNDGCGDSCGTCGSGETCQGGTCGCAAQCTTSACGIFPSGCPLFPANNIWNARIDTLPPDPNSDAYVASIGLGVGLHPDFGSGLYEGRPMGIPYVSVPSNQPGVPVTFDYGDESDPGPYPIPPDAPIEGGTCGAGDRHILIVQAGTCRLFELFDATPSGSGWSAGSGAIFDLRSNVLRPVGWTSADAAGLPILPGLVRFEEVASGVIPHALRFTAQRTRNSIVWPARHKASDRSDPNLPPMGQRFRLKSGFDIASFSPTNQVILTALKNHGMMLADNGSNWYLSGAPHPDWDNDDLHELQERVYGSDFEAVDCSSLMVDPDSGQVS